MVKGEVEIVQKNLPTDDFSKFENYLQQLGLPTDNIIAKPDERQRIMNVLPDFIGSLTPAIKKDARYLSKFVAGAAIGLFDAALNYVWNEVVISLRKKVCAYGLDMFFDSAVGEKIRSSYNTEEDLKGIKDQTLLNTCKKLELISETVYKKLSHILTMRNDIGASHPNEYSINAYELLGWLQTSIYEVIINEPSMSAITVKTIVDNLKKNNIVLTQDVVEGFNNSIVDLSSSMASNLLVSLFGLFVSEKINNTIRENIVKIAPKVWQLSNEEVKYDLGEKVDVYKVNLDNEKYHQAETFFELCGEKRYFTLDSRIIKLSSLCDDLNSAHTGWDNYYHEAPIMKNIMEYIEKAEDIPKEREDKLIKTILLCRIGREVSYMNGVSSGAKPYYDKFFSLLDKGQVISLLKVMKSIEVRYKLTTAIRRKNAVEILNIISTPLLGDRINEIVEFLIASEDHLDNAFIEKKYQDLTNGVL